MEDPFAALPQDPRDPAHAALRSSDADRDTVLRTLAEAYAQGRLDREEHDERAEQVQRSRTLGELVPVIADLVPARSLDRRPGATSPAPEVTEEAERLYRRERRQAVWTALSASLVCVVIWLMSGTGGFFWPAFVILGTGLNAGRLLVQHEDVVADHVGALEKKRDKQETRRRRAIEREEAPPAPEGP